MHATLQQPSRRAGGFTLVELLVVVVLLFILLGLLIPVVSAALQRGRTAQCLHNIRQIGVAFPLYQADHDGQFPAVTYTDFRHKTDTDFNMITQLAPYLPFSLIKVGAEWRIDIKHTCPAYKITNLNRRDPAYGMYAYQHAFAVTGAPAPQANGRGLGGRLTADLRGDATAPTYSPSHWKPQVYGIVWDTGWTRSTIYSTAAGYATSPWFDGHPAHYPAYNVLFADLHATAREWVHRGGVIPTDLSMNVPPEYRDDAYRITP